ncbi:hypothetical protein FQN54_002548 [Arachnomyces sp. PD_36]|nr:hypothetical protein FQN54_002548 [Arachnomyces sp. PD_36]
MAQDPQRHITNHLLTTKSLPVSSTWLSQFLSTQRLATTPLSAVTQTALFRILASDFTTSISASSQSTLLPIDISDPAVKERRLAGSIPVQVLDIEDISTSLWSQFEALERVERGEEVRGRQIIRTVDIDEVGGQGTGTPEATQPPAGRGGRGGGRGGGAAGRGGNATNTANTTGGSLHRLVLQDAAGTKVVAIELKKIDGISFEKLSIGAKLVLKTGATVARGIILMEPETAIVLGGKIETMHREWRQGRKARLQAQLERVTADTEGGEGQ